MNIFLSIIKMFGGLGMFLYGMNAMSGGLERVAGNKMKTIIEKVTGNIFKSVFLGIIVAALTQSSSATTVMVVGFVNAGVMSLPQATGVIMGANIGTTITAWILSLSSIEGGVWYLDIIKPDNLAPIALFLGSFLMLVGGKESRKRDIGGIIVGFGVIFIGMQYMQSSIGEIPAFTQMFAADVNPFVGVGIGAGVTAVIQSSAASVGMLQAVANMGILTFSTAFPIIMGQNIGTCVTAMLSSIGASKNARRAAMVHLYFNVIGTLFFMALIYTLNYVIGLSFWDKLVSAANISTFHSIFNVTNTLIMLPFAGVLVKLANLSVRDKEDERENPAALIDNRFLSTPSVAVSQTKKAMIEMAKVAQENVMLCRDMIKNKNFKLQDRVKENEAMLDDLEIALSNYLTNLSDRSLNMQESQSVAQYFYMVNDIERIGDYCENILQSVFEMRANGVSFTDEGNRELAILFKSVENITNLTIEAFEKDDMKLAKRVEPLEEVIDELKETLGKNHMERLKTRQCNVESGVIFMEIISNLERIADHCSNMGVAMIKQNYAVNDFNTHIYLNTVHKDMPENYKDDYDMFRKKYSLELNSSEATART